MNLDFSSHISKHQGQPFHQKKSQYLSYSNQINPPKTFQQIALRNNMKMIAKDQKSQSVLECMLGQGLKAVRKTPIKSPLIRKSNSQLLNLPLQNNLAKKGQRDRKENLDFKSILIQQAKDNVEVKRRPEIGPPSFLKHISTKSYIHNQYNNSKIHQNQFCQDLNQIYKGSQCNSISLSDSEDFNLSLNRSFLGSERDKSIIDSQNQSNGMLNSIELTKNLNDINSKINGILNDSVKEERNLFEEPYEQTQERNTKIINDKFFTDLIVPPTMQLMSSRNTSQKSNVQNPTLSSINFSKKFQTFKKSIIFKSFVEIKYQITDFDMIEEIGQGKYGKVYMAKHKGTGFLCAIKCVSKAMIRQENIELPFIREIKIQLYLNHPNIVKLYGFFNDTDNIYLIMEYCSGGHLLKLIKKKNTFQQNQILEILTNLFEAVSYLHCHGIIHRDLKPQNIVIENGIYKLCDFGWAAYARGEARTTFCGTPLYVSPEILKGQQYDAKTDIWGLGIITYELAYGRVPFPIWSQSDMRKIVSDPVYFPNWANVSQKMQNLIKTMLSKNPQDRHTINEILNDRIIKQYLGYQRNIKSEVDSLF